MNRKKVFHTIGLMLMAEAALMLPPMITAMIYDEQCIWALMAAAIAATACSAPVTILGAEAVKKSYPNFWDEYQRLGGDIHVL